jgi:hypothetical protein
MNDFILRLTNPLHKYGLISWKMPHGVFELSLELHALFLILYVKYELQIYESFKRFQNSND